MLWAKSGKTFNIFFFKNNSFIIAETYGSEEESILQASSYKTFCGIIYN